MLLLEYRFTERVGECPWGIRWGKVAGPRDVIVGASVRLPLLHRHLRVDPRTPDRYEMCRRYFFERRRVQLGDFLGSAAGRKIQIGSGV